MDIVIRSDRVVTPWGIGAYDIGIKGEMIIAVQPLNTMAGDIGQVIDATGKIVIPGGIDPHAHGSHSLGHEGTIAGPEVITRAAVWGGTTTMMDFAEQLEVRDPATGQVTQSRDLPRAIEEKNARYKGNSYCDYAFHCWLIGPPSQRVLSQVGEAIKAGFPSFKTFTTNARPVRSPQATRVFTDMGRMAALMGVLAAYGGMLMIHVEDDDIVMYNHDKAEREGQTQWWNLHLVHSSMSEDLASERVIRAAKWTGAALYLVHLSAKEAAWNVRDARIKGLPIYGETLHNYVAFTAEDYRKPDGMKYHTYPSLKYDEDCKTLWDGLINGYISTMASDEWSTSYAEKIAGKTIFDTVGGQNSMETRLPITYSEGVVKRGMPLQRFVDVVSTNAAKIMGVYPRKGAIAPGSDADIVFIDPSVRKKLSMNDLHAQDYSIWEGWEVCGWPTFTMVRGKVIIENGKLLGTPDHGKLLTGRKIAPAVLKGPAC